MSNRFAGGVKAGQTSVSTDVLLLSAVDGSELTGKVAGDFTLSYRRQGAARVAVTPVVLAALTTAWASGGVKEDMGGLYRIDFPDAAFATGVDYVMLEAFVTGSQIFHERIPLETSGAAEVKTETALIKTDTTAILAAVAAQFDQTAAAHNTAGTIGFAINAAGTASDPWSTALPGAYGAGSAGAIIGSNILDQAAASHNTANTIGAKINAAGTAADPWAVAIPGAYGAGSAGNVLGNIFSTALSESYAADGAPMTLAQALYMIMQYLTEQAISGTTMTVKRLDGTTTAYVVTLNSATTPTAKTRSS